MRPAVQLAAGETRDLTVACRQRNQRAQIFIHVCKNGHCNVHILRLTRSPPTQKHGLVIIPDGTPNGDVNHEPQPSGITVVSQEAAQLLESAGEGPLGETATTIQRLFTPN